MIEINNIYNMDCLEGLKQMEDGSVRLSVTSPPYNMRLRVMKGEYIAREKTEHFSKNTLTSMIRFLSKNFMSFIRK